MKSLGIFDILGPIMIGPSSSHTAGANRIGQVARQMAYGDILFAEVNLFNSFAKTGQGHGTDCAIIGGLLGMKEDDEDLKNALQIAKKENFSYQIHFLDAEEEHPNTAEIKMTLKNGEQLQIKGNSTGGGAIQIVEFNNMKVSFSGSYFTVIVRYLDSPGMIYQIAKVMAEHNVNIGFMDVNRESKGQEAVMVMECDKAVEESVIKRIKRDIEDIYDIYIFNPIKDVG